MADDKAIFNLTAENSENVVKALTSVTDSLESLNSAIKDIVATNLGKEFTKSGQSVEKAVGRVSKSINKLDEANQSAAESSKESNKQLESARERLERLNATTQNTYDTFDSFSSSMEGISFASIKTVTDVAQARKAVDEQIKTSIDALIAKQKEMLAAQDPKELRKVTSETKRYEQTIESLQGKMGELEIVAYQVARGFDVAFKSPATAIEDLIRLSDEYNSAQAKEASNRTRAQNEFLITLAKMKDSANNLEDAMKASTDPAIIAALSKRLDGLNRNIQAMEQSMSSKDVLMFWKNQSRDMKTVLADTTNHAKYVEMLRRELAEMTEARAKAFDPAAMDILDRKISEVSKKLKESTETVRNSQFEKFAKAAGSSTKTAAASIEAVTLKLKRLQDEQKKLQNVIKDTKDPYIKSEAKERYKEITEEVQRLNEEFRNLGENSVYIKALRDALTRLSVARLAAFDPADIKRFEDQLKSVSESLEKAVETASLGDLQKAAEEENDIFDIRNEILDQNASKLDKIRNALKPLSEQETLALETITARIQTLTKEKQKAQKLFTSSDDPIIRGAAQKQYERITKEIEEQNKLYMEQARLARSSVSGQTQLQMFGNAGKEASAFISSVQTMMNTVSKSAGNFTLFTQTIEYNERAIGKSKVTINDLFESIAAGLEKAATGFERADSIQDQMMGMGKNLSGWSKGILSNNKAIQASGKSLTTFNKISGTVAKGMGGLGNAMTALSGYAAGAMAAIEAVEIGFNIYDTLMGRSAESIKERIDAIKAEADLNKEMTETVRSGDIEQINRQKQALLDSIRARKQEAKNLIDSANKNTDTFNQMRTAIGSIFGDTTVYGQTADAVREANKEIDNMNKQLALLSSEAMVNAVNRAKEYNETIKEGESILADLSRQEDALLNLRIDALMNEQKLENDLASLDKNYSQEKLDTAKDREDQERTRLKDHLKELSSMDEDYNQLVVDMRYEHLKELEDAEKSYQKSVAEALMSHTKELAELAKDHQESIAAEELEWQEGQQKDYISYQKRLAKMEEDFNKAKIKRQKDLQQQLWEAELENDALSYFKLQRQAEKDEADALEDHKEAVEEEVKSYQEEQADKIKERQKAREEAQAEYEKDRADRIAQYEEKKAEDRKQYLEEMDAARKAFADKQEEERRNYEKEKANRVKEFREKEQEIIAENAKEDALRQEQQEKRRQELVDSYNLEIEYFQKREKLLMDYIGGIESVKNIYQPLLDDLNDGVVSAENVAAIANKAALSLKAMDLTTIDAQGNLILKGGLASSEIDQYQPVVDVLNKLRQSQELGTSVTIDQASIDALQLQISRTMSSSLINVQSEYAPQLQYTQAGQYQAYQQVSGLGTTTSATGAITDEYNKFVKQMGYSTTQLGMATLNETEDLERNRQKVLAQYGNQTLGDLRSTATEIGNETTDMWNQSYATAQLGMNQQMQALDDHFYGENQSRTKFYGAWGDATRNFLTGQQGVQEDGQQTMIDASKMFYGGAADALGASHETLNTLESDYQTNQYLARDEANALAIEQEAVQNEQMRLMSEEFGGNLEDTIDTSYSNTIDAILVESRSGTQNAASMFRSLGTEIVSVAAKAIASIRSMGSTGFSGGTTSTVRSGLSGTSRTGFRGGRGILAAKGAFIDRPTSLIAGEGRSPEVVFPFDESKGIPDDILSGIGKGLIGGLNNRNDYGKFSPNPSVPSNYENTMKAVLAALNRLSGGMELNIQSIEVGSDISRTEIRQQFSNMQKAIVDAVTASIQGTL